MGKSVAVGLQGAAILAGWALLTAGVAPLLALAHLAPWPFSGGLLLLSLAGWRYLRTLFTVGCYGLWRGITRG